MDFTDLGHAIDKNGNILAKMTFYIFQGYARIFNGIMQDAGNYRGFIHAKAGKDVSDCQWMCQIRLAGYACLTGMRMRRKHVSPVYAIKIRLWCIGCNTLGNFKDAAHSLWLNEIHSREPEQSGGACLVFIKLAGAQAGLFITLKQGFP